MSLVRSAGLLLHITSLPGEGSSGTLGREAYEFADFLEKSKMHYWQILPFNPVSSVNAYSPYSTTSTFAGNTLFINIEKLRDLPFAYEVDFKIDQNQEKKNISNFDSTALNVIENLKMLYNEFKIKADARWQSEFNNFNEENSFWIDDYALFEVLSEEFGTNNWLSWDKEIAFRKRSVLKKYFTKYENEINFQKFSQWIFYYQWGELKKYCNKRNIKLIGDIPIYVCFESADAWANPDIFQIDEQTSSPLEIAGVPPDYFSETGQRWGNPLYKWFDEKGKLCENVIQWWLKRVSHIINVVDILRIDHFRALESYWAIPETEETAINGKWKQGPGGAFFERLSSELGDLPIIAEDLGIITPEVEKLRDEYNLPGMKILQFAFDQNNKNTYILHNLRNPNCIIYTGTHDNNTTNGWYYSSEVYHEQKQYIKKYLNISDDSDMHLHFIRLAFSSTADISIIPVQDLLGLGAEHRMNTPGTVENNWVWRLELNQLRDDHSDYLRDLAYFYNRVVELDCE